MENLNGFGYGKAIYIDNYRTYQGRPLVVIDDIILSQLIIDYSKLLNVLIDTFTKALHISKKYGYSNFSMLVICNKTRINNIDIKATLNIMNILKSIYKETLHVCLITNMSKAFKVTFQFLQTFIDVNTRKKIKFTEIDSIQFDTIT